MDSDKIGTGKIRTRARVANLSETMKEGRLRWLGHTERKTKEGVVVRTWK